jgi:NADPH-dependent ferric siderophore reductase
MSTTEPGPVPPRIRREPPQFRRATVLRTEALSPRMIRVTLTGPELHEMAVPDLAASVRLLVPVPGTGELVMPSWTGNEFLMPDGRRPPLRTFTPRRFDPGAAELDLDVVLHDGGIATDWAAAAQPGAPAAISGPGRGYAIAPDATAFVLGGDESAIPAMSQLLGALPEEAAVHVRVEIAEADSRIALPEHPNARVEWCELSAGAPPGDALVTAIREVEMVPGGRVWVAGEAAAVQRIRRYLFEDLAMPRALTTVRGYWKHGRAGDAAPDA